MSKTKGNQKEHDPKGRQLRPPKAQPKTIQIEVIIYENNIKSIIYCQSMYEAHTWIIFLEAKNTKCELFVNGVSTKLSNDLQHPKTY